MEKKKLSVPAKREGVVSLPGRAGRGVVVEMTLSEPTVLRRKEKRLSVMK